jgi:hypothetical protein
MVAKQNLEAIIWVVSLIGPEAKGKYAAKGRKPPTEFVPGSPTSVETWLSRRCIMPSRRCAHRTPQGIGVFGGVATGIPIVYKFPAAGPE